MLRLQMLIATGWAAFLLWRRGDDARDWKESAIVLAASGCLVGLTILLYDLFAWRDFRLFGPAMLLSTLVFIARKRVFLVSLLIAGNLAVIPDFLAAHEQVFFKDRFSKETLQLEVFSKQIAFNCVPHIDVFQDDGFTKEEHKMRNETRKILKVVDAASAEASEIHIPALKVEKAVGNP